MPVQRRGEGGLIRTQRLVNGPKDKADGFVKQRIIRKKTTLRIVWCNLSEVFALVGTVQSDSDVVHA